MSRRRDVYLTIGWFLDKKLNRLKQAQVFYELSIELDCPGKNTSIFNLAHMIRFKHRDRAIKLFESIVDADIDAMSLLAELYHYSDPEKALYYLKRGEKLNDASCIHYLGKYYEKKEKNFEKAFEYFERASKLKYTESIIELVRCYRYGYGVEKNIYKEV